MNLPNYFLADLPAEAELSPGLITAACQTLKRNREQYLAERSTGYIIEALVEVGKSWLKDGSPFRARALGLGPGATGFSPQTLAAGLDAFFGELTEQNLAGVVQQELGHPRRLELFSGTETEQAGERLAVATGPELLVHVAGGRLPNPVFTSVILGLLARSAQFVKCATGASLLPRLFGHSLHELEPKLGACLEIAEWRGGSASLETALFAEAGCVTATGADGTLAEIRRRLPSGVRFLGYGRRVSFAYITQEALLGLNPNKLVARAARDVVAWDQLGCLSPHVVYVEAGGRVSPEQFAELLAAELARGEVSQPRGKLPPAEAAAIAARRAFYEVRAAHGSHTRLWSSPGSTAWTVVYEDDPLFQVSCLNRFIYVKATTDLEHTLRAADPVRGWVSTVGVAAPEHKTLALAQRLARWGVTRVCPLGRMQHPPLAWRHDGRPALADLVMWTDWELPV